MFNYSGLLLLNLNDYDVRQKIDANDVDTREIIFGVGLRGSCVLPCCLFSRGEEILDSPTQCQWVSG